MIDSLSASQYGNNQAYHSVLDTQQTNKKISSSNKDERQSYDTTLLKRMDNKAYQAFVNSTQSMSEEQKAQAAKQLERTIVLSDAHAYAREKKIDSTTQLSMVYNFFESLGEVVDTHQIKDLLNKRLVTHGEDMPPQQKEFAQDYLAQLGQTGRLDLRV